MSSPFPGMNPYLEQADVWHSFHEQFCTLAMELLAAQVRPGYIVKLDEHVYVHELAGDERRLAGRGDVTISRSHETESAAVGAAVIQAPVFARLPSVDIERDSFVEIRDRRDRALVTVLELLSPANKRRGPDRDQYLAKRRELLASTVHMVELDLLRGGARPRLEQLPEAQYYALVSRYEDRPEVAAWPLQLRDRLPVIPIPLRSPDRDATLDLQSMLQRLYDAGGYADYIYDSDPDPPLAPADRAWAAQLVRPSV